MARGVPDSREGSCPVPGQSSAQWDPGTGMAWDAELPAQSSFIPAERAVSGDAAGWISCRKMKRMSQGLALPAQRQLFFPFFGDGSVSDKTNVTARWPRCLPGNLPGPTESRGRRGWWWRGDAAPQGHCSGPPLQGKVVEGGSCARSPVAPQCQGCGQGRGSPPEESAAVPAQWDAADPAPGISRHSGIPAVPSPRKGRCCSDRIGDGFTY